MLVRQNPIYICNIVVLCLIGRQPKSATGPSKRTPSGTIYSILKSLLSKDKENMFILLNMKQLCPYLCQEDILPLVTFTKYSEKNMSAYEQSADYLENVLTRKPEECLKFLFCLQSEKEHPGHKQLLDYVLAHCSGKYEKVLLCKSGGNIGKVYMYITVLVLCILHGGSLTSP